jgi:lipoprotein-anchoring transpeptidase ErfK/SrfK
MTAGAGIALLAGLATPAAAFGWNSFAPAPEISQPSQMERPARTLRTTPRIKAKPAAVTEPSAPEQSGKAKPSTTEQAAKAKATAAAELPAKVKEPLQIVVSIDKQQLTLYSGSQPIAHSRVSTGTASHPTPTGVFSVIQKDRWHRSNLYNDAPMYYMQRITWSGVAMHQGVVPNHPASHGCIRLPESFARQLWGITKLGVRVVVTRGDVTPVAFAHSKLFIYKQPDPTEEEKPVEQVAAESSSTDLVRHAYRALETAQAFTKPGETATDALKLGESAFTAMARAEQKPQPAPASATSADVVKTAYDAFDMANYRRGKSAAKATAATPAAAEATPPTLKPGPISVFVSRKEGKVFVRKGFDPVFDAPVTIEHPEQPLGTHVYTALAFNDDNASLRWTVMTVPNNLSRPTPSRKRGEPVQAAPVGPASNAAAALDRITIPQPALDRISGLISAGASLVISDQGLGPETGKGTDFIVLTR